MEQKGIKETQEMVLALLKITKLLAQQFQDGIQASDAVEIVKKCMTPELEKLIVEAYNGMDQISEEIKDLSLVEGLDLLKVTLPELMSLISAITKPKA